MQLIGNEIKYCEKHLHNNTIDSKPVKTIVIMIKYFFLVKGYTPTEIKKGILEYLNSVGTVIDSNYLDGLIKTNTSPKTTINRLEKIEITEAEMEVINELGLTLQQRKVLFTLLCWYKIKKGIGYSADGTVKVDYAHLNQEAHVSLSKTKREEMLAYFVECGLIELGMGQMAKKVKLSYCNEESPVVLTITEFDCLDIYYKWYKGGCKGKLVFCKECGNLFLASKYSPAKQCEECAKERIKEYDRTRKNGK